MTFISTEILNDGFLSEFGKRHAQTLHFHRMRIKKTNRISSTIIYNIIEEKRETFTDCKLEVHFGAK